MLFLFLFCLLFDSAFSLPKSRWDKSTRGTFRERSAPPGLHSSSDRATCGMRCPTVRNFSTTSGVTWLRQQNPGQILRNRLYSSGIDRREQAKGCHTSSCDQNCAVQAAEPHHLCVGDSRSPRRGRRLWSGKHSQRQLHQSHSPEQSCWKSGPVCNDWARKTTFSQHLWLPSLVRCLRANYALVMPLNAAAWGLSTSGLREEGSGAASRVVNHRIISDWQQPPRTWWRHFPR